MVHYIYEDDGRVVGRLVDADPQMPFFNESDIEIPEGFEDDYFNYLYKNEVLSFSPSTPPVE